MTQLADFIHPNNRYRRSVNLERDLGSIQQVNGYVPTARCLELLRRFADAIAEPGSPRAWSLTGPYGSGKSSFAHFLLALSGAGGDRARKAANAVLASADKDLAGEIGRRTKRLLGGSRFIGAAATAQREPVGATVLRALHRGAIDYWSGPGRKPGVLHEITRMVEAADQDKRLPSGTRILTVIRELSERAPLILVIDEMGKNLEFAADHRADGDLYLLQQIAEAAASEEGPPVFLFTLQHLAFEEYAVGVSSTQLREWAKVQGRFEDVPFAESTGEFLKVVAKVMEVSGAPRGFATRLRKWSSDWAKVARDAGLRHLLPGGSHVLRRGYPLHPVSLLVLPELCTRYAQYDRSLFTFLTGPEPHSVGSFLKATALPPAGDLPVVGPDRLYEYFVEALGSTLAAVDGSQRWLEIQRVIREASDLTDEEARCLKVVAVLNLVDAGGALRASAGLVELALAAGPNGGARVVKQARQTLESLVSRGLLVYRKFADEYRIWRGSDFDIDAAVAQAREKLATTSIVAQLSRALPLPHLVARRHTQRTGTLRYFESRYVEEASDAECETDDPTADGLILYRVSAGGSDGSVPTETIDGRPVLVVSTPDLGELQEAALETGAILSVLKSEPQLREDKVALQEVRHRLVIADATMRLRLEEAFRAGRRDVRWHARGREVQVDSSRDLSRLLSDVCDEVYSATPTVPNEMVNRRVLTSQGAKARRELIEAMIVNGAEEHLGFRGFGPERTMYDAVLASTGLHGPAPEGGFRYMKPKRGGDLRAVWNAINSFFEKADIGPREVSELYETLMPPPFGLKDGLIPVLLTAALLYRAEDVGIYQEETFQPALTPDLMERLVKTPDRFAVKHFGITGGRKALLDRLMDAVGLNREEERASRYRNASLLAVVRPIINLLRGLPPYALQTRRISSTAQSIREALMNTREPDELLFTSLPRACGFQPFVKRERDNEKRIDEFAKEFANGLRELISAYQVLLEHVQKHLAKVLGAKASTTVLREDVRTRSRHLTDQVIDPALRSFLLMAVNEDLEDREWLEALAMNLTQKPPESWADEDVARFESSLFELGARFRRVEVLHYEALEHPSEGFDARRLTLTTPQGEEFSAIVWVDRSKADAAEALATKMLEHAESLGDGGHEALMAVLAERFLGAEEAGKSGPLEELGEERMTGG